MTLYDNGQVPFADVDCYGEHLINGDTTLDSLPSYPYIGAAPQISGTEFQYCNSCWEISYTDLYGTVSSVNFTAIDGGKYGPGTFVVSLEVMDDLTSGLAGELVSVPITATSKPCN